MSLEWTADEREAAERLIVLALAEDLGEAGDVTTQALVPSDLQGCVDIVARQAGVLAGGPVIPLVLTHWPADVACTLPCADGDELSPGQVVAELRGPVRVLLEAERTILNFLTHLSGVATLTHRFVREISGCRAQVFDTRKTLPGWRLLQKYAVRAGGGHNHRIGLYDMVLIKDNHLAAWLATPGRTLAGAVEQARQQSLLPIEIEVDTLDQLREVLPARPDMVLLDNMDIASLRQAVAMRDELAPGVELEASGGISLATVRAIAATGIDRISSGALTHSAVALDLAFDWHYDTPRGQRVTQA